MVYMFVNEDVDTGYCEIEYDLGFFCSTDCLVRSMQLHEGNISTLDYRLSRFRVGGGIMTTETKWERLLHDQLDCKDTNCEEE